MAFRPGRPAPSVGFQGEGLLAVDPGDGSPVRIIQGSGIPNEVPSIRAQLNPAGRLVVSTDGPVLVTEVATGLREALDLWAEEFATATGPLARPSLPAVWCSWYCYWREVTGRDVLANELDARRLGIDIGVVQIDDGWQSAVGDWDSVNPRFGDLERTVGTLRDHDREVGIWLAPFLAAEDSSLAANHPDWLLPGVEAGFNWGSPLRAVDTTHPDPAEYLQRCIRWLANIGVSYFKLDFLYAGALETPERDQHEAIASYRAALRLLREAAPNGAIILGCGAPLLPSSGLVDAMRISPDVMPTWDPPDGDISQPGGRSALLAGAARTHLNGRLWVNDPDCLLARPRVEHRETWAEHLRTVGGLASTSDPLAELDGWGLATTRSLMHPSTTA